MPGERGSKTIAANPGLTLTRLLVDAETSVTPAGDDQAITSASITQRR